MSSLSSFDKRLVRLGSLAALFIAGVLVIQFVDFDKNTDEEEFADPFGDQNEPVFQAGADATVISIRVADNQTGDVFDARLNAATGAWDILEAPEDTDTGLGVDQPLLTGSLFALPNMIPSGVLNEIEALAAYGLTESLYTIEFSTSDGNTYRFEVGGKNPGDTAYYTRIDGESSTIYLLPTFTIDSLADFIINPPFVQPLEGEDGEGGDDDTGTVDG